jgi:hypothetical protein
MKRSILFLFCAALLIATAIPAFALWPPKVLQECGCKHRFPMKDAPLAFMGKLTHIAEVRRELRGIGYYYIELYFDVEERWNGVPDTMHKIKLRTDTTSCGHGAALTPDTRDNMIGASFGIFAQQPHLTICNSVMADESWLALNPNPFKTHIPSRVR